MPEQTLNTTPPQTPEPPGNGASSDVSPNRLKGFLRNLTPFRVLPTTAPGPAAESTTYGVHGITKNVDVWFEYRVHEVRDEALQFAHDWAQAAIPRSDVVYAEIPPETILARRCSEVMRSWRERLLNRVQDAINQLTGRIGMTLVEYRDGITSLVRTRANVAALENDAREKAASLAQYEGSTEIQSMLKGSWKYLLMAALVFADWVANVPVFYELLPKDAAADQALVELLENTEGQALAGGLLRMLYRFLHSPEASILALTVVLFLMIFGHKLGESLRELVAFKEADAPTIRTQIAARRRQSLAPLLFSVVGVGLLVYALYSSRAMLVDSTRERLAEENRALVTAEARRDAAFRTAGVSDGDRAALEAAVANQRVMVSNAEDRVRYATTLTRANSAILVLNLVLALSAALIGYLGHKGMVGGRQQNPELTAMRARIADEHARASEMRLRVQQAESRITDDLSELDRFITSQPLAGWEAKADRLKATVQLFRSENARLRGIDSANIMAFRNPIAIEWPDMAQPHHYTEPAEVREYREEFARLRAELQAYDRNATAQVAV